MLHMDLQRLRELRLAHPFKPFRLLLRDGRDLAVERPSYLAISPIGTSIVYALERGGFEQVKADDIQEAIIDESTRRLRRPSA